MASYGVEADMAMTGDHFIAVAFYEVFQHFFLAFGKVVLQAAGAGGPEELQHFFGDDRRERCAAMEYVLDGFEKVDKGGVFKDIAVCSAAEALEKALVVFQHRVHDDIG